MRRLIPPPAMAVALVALLAASTGWAIAATSNHPVIRACANKKTGVLRLAKRCRRRERSISWDKEGFQGPQGLTGATGATGPAGPTGEQLSRVVDEKVKH
jgi:hypothetical protein